MAPRPAGAGAQAVRQAIDERRSAVVLAMGSDARLGADLRPPVVTPRSEAMEIWAWYGLVFSLASIFLSGGVWPAIAVTVALDVGHSLAHPGATSARGVPEFVFNRALALVVRQRLAQQGWQVRVIGAQGDMQDLRARTQAASGADVFLSLHHDSVQPQYLETWTPAD